MPQEWLGQLPALPGSLALWCPRLSGWNRGSPVAGTRQRSMGPALQRPGQPQAQRGTRGLHLRPSLASSPPGLAPRQQGLSARRDIRRLLAGQQVPDPRRRNAGRRGGASKCSWADGKRPLQPPARGGCPDLPQADSRRQGLEALYTCCEEKGSGNAQSHVVSCTPSRHSPGPGKAKRLSVPPTQPSIFPSCLPPSLGLEPGSKGHQHRP